MFQNETPLSSPSKTPVVVDSFNKKMEDAEKECNKNARRFKARLRLTDPDCRNPAYVANYCDVWHRELTEDLKNVTQSVRNLY